jgi:E3 ubiquitin-protein ligase RNF14
MQFVVCFVPSVRSPKAPVLDLNGRAVNDAAAYIERDVEFTHLPPINLHVFLPQRYPEGSPPKVDLTTTYDWLPNEKLLDLERAVESLWEEYGRCQILFAYIDHLQQAIERAFDLDQGAQGCLVLPANAEAALRKFDLETSQAIFNADTFDCGICLEPKKGVVCYQLENCGHVFCRQCLQDFYNNAISEGDISNVKCLSPDCGKGQAKPGTKRKRERTLSPRELLQMGIEESMVRRYLEMKRKKKLEADKNTVYCPRTWCQGPARSAKYPPIPTDLLAYDAAEPPSEDETDDELHADASQQPLNPKNSKNLPPNPTDRLAVCEKCSFAFCQVCYMGWHGPFARCYPRDPSELSAEEKASYDYIRLNTSPCPYCNSPTQKTMGCNHMKCYQCNTHFCYLCGELHQGGITLSFFVTNSKHLLPTAFA